LIVIFPLGKFNNVGIPSFSLVVDQRGIAFCLPEDVDDTSVVSEIIGSQVLLFPIY
jgi:hypothetical protein